MAVLDMDVLPNGTKDKTDSSFDRRTSSRRAFMSRFMVLATAASSLDIGREADSRASVASHPTATGFALFPVLPSFRRRARDCSGRRRSRGHLPRPLIRGG